MMWKTYRKTTLTQALRLKGPEDIPPSLQERVRPILRDGLAPKWSVETREGLAEAKWGDWLAIDSNGDPYPIAADVFEKTYEEAAS